MIKSQADNREDLVRGDSHCTTVAGPIPQYLKLKFKSVQTVQNLIRLSWS